MSWKEDIKNQIKEASQRKAISPGLKEVCNTLLKGDSEFILVYSSSREKYTRLEFRVDKVDKETVKLILNEYGPKVWKILKPKK